MAFPTQSAGLVKASTQYFTAGDAVSLSGTGNTTLELWVNFTSLPASGSGAGLMGHSNATGNLRALRFALVNNAGTLQLELVTNSDGTSATNTLTDVNWTPSTGTWYHVAVVYTAAGGTADYYVDGVQQGTQQSGHGTSIFDTTASFSLGLKSIEDTTNTLDGRIVLARYWSTTRTGAQISTNKCVVLGATSNLGGEWTLDNTLNDNSGNTNTLTNVNTATFTTDVPAVCSAVVARGVTNMGILLGVGQ